MSCARLGRHARPETRPGGRAVSRSGGPVDHALSTDDGGRIYLWLGGSSRTAKTHYVYAHERSNVSV